MSKNTKTMFALTEKEVCDDNLSVRIKVLVDSGHDIVLSVDDIPQSNDEQLLKKFKNLVKSGQKCLKDKFNYDLQRVYNIDKLTILHSVDAAINKVGLDWFTRSFKGNLRDQASLAQQVRKNHIDGNEVIMQLSLKAKEDVKHLDQMAQIMTSLGYANDNSIKTPTKPTTHPRLTFLLDGFLEYKAIH